MRTGQITRAGWDARMCPGSPGGRFQPPHRSAALGGRAGTLRSVSGEGGRVQKLDRSHRTPAIGSPAPEAMPWSAAPAFDKLCGRLCSVPPAAETALRHPPSPTPSAPASRVSLQSRLTPLRSRPPPTAALPPRAPARPPPQPGPRAAATARVPTPGEPAQPRPLAHHGTDGGDFGDCH